MKRDYPEETTSTKFRAISNRMPRTKRDLNSLSRANIVRISWRTDSRTREEKDRRMEDATATRRRKWRGEGNKKSAGTDRGKIARRKPRTRTGNRNAGLVPANFIGAKGRHRVRKLFKLRSSQNGRASP